MTTHVPAVPGGHYSLQTILRSAGLNDTEAQMAVVGMWWSPSESQPDSAIVHVITTGVQRLLQRLGEPIKITGIYGTYTHKALVRQLGVMYSTVAWEKIYEELLGKLANNAIASEAQDGFLATGSIDSSEFSTSDGNWTATSSSAKSYVKNLQSQINRFADKAGTGTISVDGVVGQNTATTAVVVCTWIVNNAPSNSNSTIYGIYTYGTDPTIAASNASLISAVAAAADDLGAAFKDVADSLNLKAPSSGGGGSTRPVLQVSESSMIVPALIGGGLLLWMLSGKKKGGGRRKKGWF